MGTSILGYMTGTISERISPPIKYCTEQNKTRKPQQFANLGRNNCPFYLSDSGSLWSDFALASSDCAAPSLARVFLPIIPRSLNPRLTITIPKSVDAKQVHPAARKPTINTSGDCAPRSGCLLLYALDTESAISDATASPIAVASCSQKNSARQNERGNKISYSRSNAENSTSKGLRIFIERYSDLLIS